MMIDDKVIAIDFDGTLFEDVYPYIGKPMWAVINYCRAEKRNGSKLILWTCRCEERLKEAVEACRCVGLEFDAVNENLQERIFKYGNDCRKVSADVYIDDRNVLVSQLVDVRVNNTCDIISGQVELDISEAVNET